MRASTTGVIVAIIFATFVQELRASYIREVRVLPTCAIIPSDRVILEVLLLSATTPTYFFEPTQIEIIDNQIAIDLFATSGNLLALSSSVAPIDLGSHRPGSYSFTIRLHGQGGPEVQEYSDTFEVAYRRCPDLPLDSRHLYWANEGGIIKRASIQRRS